MKPVYLTPSELEAALIHGFLVESGFEAEVVNDGLGGVSGESPVAASSLATILVRDEDMARAQALIEERSVWIEDEEWGEETAEPIDADLVSLTQVLRDRPSQHPQ